MPYRINEVFYSLQGEGVRAGTAAVFIRFSKCNLACSVEPGPRSPGGFDCDTEFESGRSMTLDEIHAVILREALAPVSSAPLSKWQPWIILTGGEPALQVDQAFCEYFHQAGFRLAIETNGSIELPTPVGPPPAWRQTIPLEEYLQEALRYYPFEWITVSPKVAEHAIRQIWAHEVKYVRGVGQVFPETRVRALHQLVSPTFRGDEVDPAALAWCIELVRKNPHLRLSVQQHKGWGAR